VVENSWENLSDSEYVKFRKRIAVNQIAIKASMCFGTVKAIACPMVITPFNTWMIPAAVRLAPRMQVKINMVDASK
jgi:hypothetical protein